MSILLYRVFVFGAAKKKASLYPCPVLHVCAEKSAVLCRCDPCNSRQVKEVKKSQCHRIDCKMVLHVFTENPGTSSSESGWEKSITFAVFGRRTHQNANPSARFAGLRPPGLK
jgi:hypothetical protein